MGMEHIQEVLRVAKENGAVCLYRSPDWNTCEVWTMGFQAPGEEFLCIGIPQFIFFRDGHAYVASDKESAEYRKWMSNQPGSEEDDEYEEDPDEIVLYVG